MWNRAQLKQRAKDTLRTNYWVCVVVAFILTLAVGTSGPSFNASSSRSNNDSVDELVNEILQDDSANDYNSTDDFYSSSEETTGFDIESLSPEAVTALSIFGFAAVTVIVILLIALVVSAVLKIFLFNPLEVGAKRFFALSHLQNTLFNEVGYAFSHNYKTIILTLFLRDLYIFLWSCLFIIPGIIKSYEYRMVPFLLAEYPDMDKNTAFSASKEMMYGNKWDAFVLDLSFILWNLLSAITLGLVGTFYVNPYIYLTDSALYLELSNTYRMSRNNTQQNQTYQNQTYQNTTTDYYNY